MDPYLLLALILLLFTAAAAGPSLLGGERLAWGSAGEILAWGAALLLAAWALRLSSPFVYLVVLYLVAMRARLLVDAANALAVRRRPVAFRLYSLAQHLALGQLDRANVQVNRGAALLYSGQVAAAVAVLEGVLAGPQLGAKLGAACCCNLGLAYLRLGEAERGRVQLREAVERLPGSVYARRARVALARLDATAGEA